MPDFEPTPGFTLHFDEWGDAEAPPVILLHGFTSTNRMWGGQVPALAAEYRVIAPDLRGHGKTTAPEETSDYGIERYAEDLRALMDHLELEAAAVVGCSFGGMIALQFGVTYPERVAALVVSDASPAYDRPDYDDRFRKREAGMRETEEFVRTHGAAAMGKRAAASIEDAFLKRATLDRYARMSSDGFLGAAYTRRTRPDVTGLLAAKLTMPVLLVDGEDDPVFCALDVMAKELPGARVVSVRGAGHGVPSLKPETFTDVLVRFLHDVEDGQPIAGRLRV